MRQFLRMHRITRPRYVYPSVRTSCILPAGVPALGICTASVARIVNRACLSSRQHPAFFKCSWLRSSSDGWFTTVYRRA